MRMKDPEPKVMETVGQNGEVHKGFERVGSFHAERAGNPDSIEAHIDGDWACDDIYRKSASAG